MDLIFPSFPEWPCCAMLLCLVVLAGIPAEAFSPGAGKRLCRVFESKNFAAQRLFAYWQINDRRNLALENHLFNLG